MMRLINHLGLLTSLLLVKFLKMASDRGKWETVVTKKKGQVSKSDVKKAKKNFVDNFSQHKAEFKSTYINYCSLCTRDDVFSY